ncbi:hypothetical protein GCM10009682_20570 [Luedemannella flava]|uniref:DUF4097 domain-containing protein n=1 Tax=Luedemannella flava TaxID=349316 RepID=A0ABP4Y1L1_9ACTN
MRVIPGLAVVTAGVLTLALTGCAVGGPLQTENQSQEYAEKITRVELTAHSGDVRFAPAATETVSVARQLRWRAEKPKVTETVNGSTLRISVTCPKIGTCEVDYDLKVPTAASVQVRTDSGDITLAGITGDLDVGTDSGNVTVDDAAGTVRAETDSGDVKGGGLRSADVAARTDSGEVRLTFVAAPSAVTATSSSGDVTVAVPAVDGGYRVRAGTDAGSRTVTVVGTAASTRAITAQTDSGDVTVR